MKAHLTGVCRAGQNTPQPLLNDRLCYALVKRVALLGSLPVTSFDLVKLQEIPNFRSVPQATNAFWGTKCESYGK